MTEKHKSAEAYCKEKTLACETALVLLLQTFGTLKPTVRLIGGLVPRYLAPEVPAHVGTTDVDVVLDVAVLAAGEDYSFMAFHETRGPCSSARPVKPRLRPSACPGAGSPAHQ